jgi:hypothetical protein
MVQSFLFTAWGREDGTRLGGGNAAAVLLIPGRVKVRFVLGKPMRSTFHEAFAPAVRLLIQRELDARRVTVDGQDAGLIWFYYFHTSCSGPNQG